MVLFSPLGPLTDPFSLREKAGMRAEDRWVPSPYPLPEGEDEWTDWRAGGFQQRAW
ncbi:MAG: hypothetical protein QOH24_1482 [Verrucomicrobiota bacterium]